MRFIVRVTDYHYGGHVLFVVLSRESDYRLTSHRKEASIFDTPTQLADIHARLVNNGRRTVEIEQIVDSELLDQMNAI